MDLFVLPMDLHLQQGELRYGLLTSGTRFVMTAGALMMDTWSANSLIWDCQQSTTVLIMDEVLGKYF